MRHLLLSEMPSFPPLRAVSGCLFLLALPLAAQPTLSWSQGDPTPQEQQAMEWLNAGRRDPGATLTGILGQAGSDAVIAGFLLAQTPTTAAQFEQWVEANAQIAWADSAQFPSSEAVSTAPLAFYPLFQQQAEAWAAKSIPPALNFPAQRPPPAYIYPVPTFGSMILDGPSNLLEGPNATGGTAQFGPYGANATEVSEANLYAAYITPREWMLSALTASFPSGNWSPPPEFLLQGDSIPGLKLGHTRMAGIGIAPGQNGNQILSFYRGSSEFFTQSDLPFGAAGTVFITGVAYRDQNANGHYDPGEGIAGVRITPDHGDWYAVTSASGGYAIPAAANSGDFVVTATGGPFAAASAEVRVGSDSAKLDWVLPAIAATPPPQVAVPQPDGTNQLIGLSTRGLMQTGDAVLIAGFVIAGPADAQKQLLIRAVGPSLQEHGLPAAECLPATQLQVNRGATAVAANAGWTSAADGGAAAIQAAAKAGDFPLVNWTGGGGDSALVITLSPGAYTVVAGPAAGAPPEFQSGRLGLIEIYDLTPSDGSRFVNLSTRGLVGTGDSQMIIGCTVTGNGHERLLLRGAGPALAASLAAGETLPDPSLSLFGAAGLVLAANDDWGLSAQAAQMATTAEAVGAFPFAEGSADAALLALVAPGNYSAIVSAQPGTGASGLALIEMYEAP